VQPTRKLARLFSALKGGLSKAPASFGVTYIGHFEPDGRRIAGNVVDVTQASERVADWLVNRPTLLVAQLNGVQIGSGSSFERQGTGWRFEFDVNQTITAEDVLQDRLKVFALDHNQSRSEIRIDGAVQLSYVKQAHGRPSELELLIDFSQRGNSRTYLRDGWHGQEPDHVWTDGTHSTILLPFSKPGSDYGLEILAWPFVEHEKIAFQSVELSISQAPIGRFYLSPGQKLLECDITADLTLEGEALLQLHHPNAAKPSHFASSEDGRVLALAYRRIRLKRYLGDSSGSASDS
jgi:hypothetical protein